MSWRYPESITWPRFIGLSNWPVMAILCFTLSAATSLAFLMPWNFEPLLCCSNEGIQCKVFWGPHNLHHCFWAEQRRLVALKAPCNPLDINWIPTFYRSSCKIVWLRRNLQLYTVTRALRDIKDSQKRVFGRWNDRIPKLNAVSPYLMGTQASDHSTHGHFTELCAWPSLWLGGPVTPLATLPSSATSLHHKYKPSIFKAPADRIWLRSLYLRAAKANLRNFLLQISTAECRKSRKVRLAAAEHIRTSRDLSCKNKGCKGDCLLAQENCRDPQSQLQLRKLTMNDRWHSVPFCICWKSHHDLDSLCATLNLDSWRSQQKHQFFWSRPLQVRCLIPE